MDQSCYIEYLKMCIEKHREEIKLYYTRNNLFIACNMFIVGALVIVISSSSKLQPQFIWMVAAIICIFAAVITRKWHSIVNLSAEYIYFWSAKICYLEALHAPDDQACYYLLDRIIKEPKELDVHKLPRFKEEKIEEINRTLQQMWSKPPSKATGIAKIMSEITMYLTLGWIVAAVSFFVLLVLQYDPRY